MSVYKVFTCNYINIYMSVYKVSTCVFGNGIFLLRENRQTCLLSYRSDNFGYTYCQKSNSSTTQHESYFAHHNLPPNNHPPGT